jgi:hypothetical protein
VYQVGGGVASLMSQYVWFGRKLIFDGNPVYPDRLGTNRSSGASYTSYSTFLGTAGAPSRYLPYGEELTSTPSCACIFDHGKLTNIGSPSFPMPARHPSGASIEKAYIRIGIRFGRLVHLPQSGCRNQGGWFHP